MHHHPGWLVDHDEVLILKQDRQRDRLRQVVGRRWGRGQKAQALGSAQLLSGPTRATVQGHLAGFNPPGELRSGKR
jgi:hypothetical protein